MKDDQKLLIIIGAILTLVSAAFLSTTGVPQTPTPAMLFPLSILGFFFGVGFIIWSLAWIGLEKTNLLK